MDEGVKIKITREYEKFRKLGGNRPIDENHVRRLMNAMREQDMFVPIQCNTSLEVIDGQHRLEARRRLGLPVPYFVVEGEYGLKQVQTINAQQKKWSTNDYLESNLEQGNEEYKIYEWFRRKYGFGHTESLQMLCLDFTGRELHQAFNLGLFRVKDLTKAKEMAETLIRIEPYYPGFRRRSFVRAILALLPRKNFDFEVFIKKLIMQPNGLKDCTTAAQYIDLIEELYNYRSSKKVSLKYSD